MTLKKSFLGKKKIMLIRLHKLKEIFVFRVMTCSIISSYVITTPPPFISVIAPLPLWPHREEVRRRRGDCGTSAASFLESSGTNQAFDRHLSQLSKESLTLKFFIDLINSIIVLMFCTFLPNKQSGNLSKRYYNVKLLFCVIIY